MTQRLNIQIPNADEPTLRAIEEHVLPVMDAAGRNQVVDQVRNQLGGEARTWGHAQHGSPNGDQERSGASREEAGGGEQLRDRDHEQR